MKHISDVILVLFLFVPHLSGPLYIKIFNKNTHTIGQNQKVNKELGSVFI